MASKIQAVFFDLGDTLVQISFVTLAKICKRISEVRGVPLNTDEYTRAFRNEWDNRSNPSETKLVKDIKTDADESERRYWRNFFKSLILSLGISSDQSELIEWLINIYTDPKSFVCFDDVYRVLSELKSKDLTLGIISNAFPSADKILDRLNLRQYFKYIFLSFELPYAKPETEVYHFVANKTNILIENIIFIDDRWSFVKGAQEANMDALLIERFPEKSPEVHTKSSVKKIRNLKELMEIINFSQVEEINVPQEQEPFSIDRRDEFWNFCKLPIK